MDHIDSKGAPVGAPGFRSLGVTPPRHRKALLCAAAGVAIATALAVTPPAMAETGGGGSVALVATPPVGGTVVNPLTGASETVVQIVSPIAVLTSNNNVILLLNTVGDTYTSGGLTYTVTAVTTNGAGGLVDTVTVKDNASTPTTQTLARVEDKSAEFGTSGGDTGAMLNPVVPIGNNVFSWIQRGGNGDNGSDGGGVCVLGVCISVDPDPGEAGDPGPDLTFNLTLDYQSTANDLPTISVVSIGGNGGQGGDGIGIDVPGADGGAAGAGGHVTVTSSGTLATSGANSYGIFAQSRAGIGGEGGEGWIASGGGGGGGAAQGGQVDVTNTGSISTTGTGAYGILAQSLGGASGDGGGSYGIVGDGGGGSSGGNGGVVTVEQQGTILTTGQDAHGVLAQSVGGSGGNAGASGGIVTFGSSGSAGGSGGSATINARSGSSTTTTGDGAYGLFAQSIGGGGGNGGIGIGLVSLGASGGGGGNGGSATITVENGASVTTSGAGSHALFAESIGGGGGSGGVSGGVVALGGSGAGGGNGGTVTITSGGAISTTGVDARGVFAQSVGGGGGSAAGTGGVVSLGGSGSGGGSGGSVTVTTQAGGSVSTTEDGADGVFAQSVGGGGGSGSASGGVVALGGTGSGGGSGGTVMVTNGGIIGTEGDRARGVFAQSVGGGGGSGGDGGGLVIIGGGGGTASAGGTVTVTNNGAITTLGAQSSAIQAQSIGGGGGDGGSTGGVFLTIGGNGAGGGGSGVVTVNQSGFLSTAGDDSHGIFAQSVGGGGGNGGSTVSVSAFAGVAIGGSGDGGGAGGDVHINLTQKLTSVGGVDTWLDPVIVTTGDRSHGIFAQSVGGGGGNGGFAAQVSAGYAVGASAAVGGTGGAGGGAGTVTLDGDVDVFTSGQQSYGIFAQSVGGGGGSGGFALSFAFSGGETAAAAFSVAVGGSGGNGGTGGHVDVDSGGSITTTDDFSTGLVAQSVGGGGGNGGFTVSVAGSGAGAGSGSVAVGVGGSGGEGGVGGQVDVSFDGTISTAGDDAGGALIQSVGGGGGDGGFNVSGAVSISGVGGVGAAVGVGGSGGEGGAGGNVTGSIGDTVETQGDRSTGVIVQSVGGGGGNGGFNVSGSIGGGGTVGGAISVGVGGAGGGGGDAGTVDAWAASITTHGDQSGGFLAQSVGGGGGNGGFNVSAGIAGAETAAGSISVGVGGAGGGGGTGARVGATVTGDVTTFGQDSDAIVAQSIGGGGGSGGFAVAAGITGSVTGSGSISVGVGGSGGDGGGSGDVTLAVTGTTQTAGANSDAIMAQSVGGGGGSGGLSVAGNIAISATGAGTLGVSVGGTGGGGGDAGAVTLNVNTGASDPGDTLIAALTTGDGARAVVAQSVGGGGGNGGISVAGGIAAAKDGAGNVGVGVGGGGGDGGNAGAVIGNVTGDVQTGGADASGVLVQSVGGGGGNGGFNITGGIAGSNSVAGNILVGVGGFGGGGGDAGAVSGALNGDVLTLGDRSFGVTYQSLGGGGGNGGFNITGGISLSLQSGGGAGTLGVGVGGFGGDGGAGSTVNASVIGDITTTGDDAHGALLQSVGGGGGTGGFNVTGSISASSGVSGTLGVGVGGFGGGGGDAGAVTGTLSGDVTTYGDNSFGAMLQSLGGGGGSGGLNVTGSLSFTANNSASIAMGVGLGGFGGGGGNSGAVTGTVTGSYITFGENADGVVVQSVGGGGGSGGLNVSGAVALGTGTAGTGVVGIGGFGGDGGSAGNVSLVRVGDTQTDGADSDGIMVQSLGGGGGDGGINISGGLSATTSGSAGSLGFGLGGFGGGGGAAGDVTVHVSGNVWAQGLGSDTVTEATTITIDNPDRGPDEPDQITLTSYRTRADGSNGVVAQSIGGGGGAGGLNVTGQLSITAPNGSPSRAVTLGVGGFGGSGGDAGTVNLTIVPPGTQRVQVQAIGDNRSAVIAQSVGGGGGAGGINVSGGLAMDGTLTAGIGGFGGGGGLGRDVTADVDADLFAAGDLSRGLMAQSIGGGGGAGAINISGGVTADLAATEPSVTFGLGGFGGAGNSSGNVDVDQHGQVWVEGVGSVGVLVQSIAGGGGSGGLNVSADLTLGSAASKHEGFAIAVGVGGTGGTGADAGDVDLHSVGNIFINARAKTNPAEGEDPYEAVDYTGGATGILAQSIGGGGGVGGINATGAVAPFGSPVALGVGGSGGTGGNAGTVTVIRENEDADHVGLIKTFGDKSSGIIAQSVGGGGGQAGMNFTFAGSATADNPIAAVISVGGSGGGAGDGDTVTVQHQGRIETDGEHSRGIVAQSIGGGGGDANFNIGLGLIRHATALDLAVGGATGQGGSGGDVVVDHVGTIVTKGGDSAGILAQSVGGGGGDTSFDFAIGALADHSIDITVGRRGGDGGAAGNVSVSSEGVIDTTGDDSSGIFAQSVGGGGGKSSAVTVGATLTSGAGSPQAQSYTGNVSVGLEGGTGATGGDVTVDAAGFVTTRGDESRGIWAQSIGGGGGAGGAAGNNFIFATGGAGVAVGGTGGTGATSGHVTVTNDAQIETSGDRADGILAQSVGGGGGMGGMARTISLQVAGVPQGSSSGTGSINVGGSGGTGAVGGAVDVTNTGVVYTTGEQSFGVRAQSIGGGGGVGGSTVNVRLQGPRTNYSFDVNVGGSGGTGGAGGAVNVVNQGTIWTEGRDAAGIIAASVGGGGGDGGLVLDVVGGFSGSGNNSHRFVMNIGGSGGVGGVGGAVNVVNEPVTGVANSGLIVTRGENAYGIFAQSIGGGGGNGSSVVSLTGLITGENSVSAGLTLGGAGGDGNTGGTVTVTNAGQIDTTGDGAIGILAQSVGGGGGTGGLAIAANAAIGATANTPLITIGGVGGDGGDGGAVTVTNSGTIVTRGANADGILAQSIGGGGGDAQMGFSLTGEVKSMVLSNALSALIGATGGGTGGTGGAVTVNHSGDITVLGDGSTAIRAESINGGGGSLTLNFDGIIGLPGVPIPTDTNSGDPLVVTRMGADGVSGMNAGLVTVNSTGTLGLSGANSLGSFDQAIGGGGGTLMLTTRLASELDDQALVTLAPIAFQIGLGGSNGVNNNGGDITSSHTGMIVTTGTNTPGALIQSIGGGGGRAVVDITVPAGGLLGDIEVALGGTNGLNEAGGDVSRSQSGQVITTGDLSTGAILQSIGGGGGSASVTLHGDGATGSTVLATLGADGGSGLNGGNVAGVFSGGVQTMGEHALGLLVQSVGGGGGELRLDGVSNLDATLGGTNGATGDGGAISLTNSGDVVTLGDGSHGVFLQSIGGGGGAVFGAVNVQTLAFGDGAGNGGAIAFEQAGDIVATGDGVYGLVAQSLGGGGGWIDGVFAGTAGGDGQGGTIDLSIDGQVFAPGADSVGVFAQSLGGQGGGDINLVANGMIRGGDGTGAGVKFDGGATNVITTSGSISAVSGLAIDTTSGDDLVNNDGVVVGDVDLGSGDNTFHNRLGSTFIAYHTIDLRDDVVPFHASTALGANAAATSAMFINDGDFLMGLSAPRFPIDLLNGDVFGNLDGIGDPTTNLLYGARVINTVALDGNYLQTADGHLAFDVAFGPYASDRVNVTGDATVNGTGDVILTWLENKNPVTLFATGGDGHDDGLQITDTLAIDFSVLADSAGVHLTLDTDFGQPFLNRNGRSLGRHMDSAITIGGSSGIGRLAALLGNLQAGEEDIYASIFTELSPEPHVAPLHLQLAKADGFADDLFRCAPLTQVAITEQCVWSRFEIADSDVDRSFENFSIESDSTSLRGGFQRPLDGPWSVAGAIGYDTVSALTVDNGRARSEGNGLTGALGFERRTPDGTAVGLSLSGGWTWLDTHRGVNVFGFQVGQADAQTGFVQARVDAGKLLRSGAFFARPSLGASVTALHHAGFRERGLAGLGFDTEGDTKVIGALKPELTLGAAFGAPSQAHAVVSLTVGGRLSTTDELSLPFRFIGAAPGSRPAVMETPYDPAAWRVSTDLTVLGAGRTSLHFGYTGEFGRTGENHRGGLDLRIKF